MPCCDAGGCSGEEGTWGLGIQGGAVAAGQGSGRLAPTAILSGEQGEGSDTVQPISPKPSAPVTPPAPCPCRCDDSGPLSASCSLAVP